MAVIEISFAVSGTPTVNTHAGTAVLIVLLTGIARAEVLHRLLQTLCG
ncbi:hypothetical protein [Amycolatopsis sp. YIM 10]|nr:hypothetical protein [Amycolatopsis sp. YIM 10]